MAMAMAMAQHVSPLSGLPYESPLVISLLDYDSSFISMASQVLEQVVGLATQAQVLQE